MTKRTGATEFLADGPVASTDILAQARARGFSERTLRGNEGKTWHWELPPVEEQTGDQPAA